MKLKNLFKEILYWFKCHFLKEHKYHIIDLRSPYDHYRYGWIDQDERIYLACFKCFTEYVELEDPFERTELPTEIENEIKQIYKWWTEERFEEMRKLDELSSATFKDRFDIIEGVLPDNWNVWLDGKRNLEEKEDEMLDRLMRIRKYFWT